jgi:hypothetical protein
LQGSTPILTATILLSAIQESYIPDFVPTDLNTIQHRIMNNLLSVAMMVQIYDPS